VKGYVVATAGKKDSSGGKWNGNGEQERNERFLWSKKRGF
jgi:hypothetical protein